MSGDGAFRDKHKSIKVKKVRVEKKFLDGLTLAFMSSALLSAVTR